MVCRHERFQSNLTDMSLPAHEYKEILKPSVYIPKHELLGNMVLGWSCASYENNYATSPSCSEYTEYLNKHQVPLFTLCNGLQVRETPEELLKLGFIECLLISRIIIITYELHITVQSEYQFSNSLAICPLLLTHVFDTAFPRLMLLDINDLTQIITVLMTGVSGQNFRGKLATLMVWRDIIKKVLKWLKENNALYMGIKINQNCLTLLSENDILDVIRTRIKIYSELSTLPTIKIYWQFPGTEAYCNICDKVTSSKSTTSIRW